MAEGNHSGSAGPAAELAAATEQARQAMQRRDWAEACRWWDRARALAPDHPASYLGGGNALRQSGRLDEAEALLAEAAKRFPDHEQIALTRAGVANARGDWPTAVAGWAEIRRRFPDNPASYLGSINALRGADKTDQAEALIPAAEAALAASKARDPGALSGLQLELAIAKLKSDWSAVQRSAEAIIAHGQVPGPEIFLALAQACWHLELSDAAGDAARRALEIDPALSQAIIVLAWIATKRGDGETAVQCYRRLAELNPGTVRWSLKLIQLLNWLGHVDEAVRELELVRTRLPNDPQIKAFMRWFGPGSALSRAAETPNDAPSASEDLYRSLLDAAPGEAAWKRPILQAEPRMEIQVGQVNGAETAVLIFTGAQDGMSMPIGLFDRYLATFDATAVYLKDFRRLVYLQGIRSLDETYQGTLDALRSMLNGFGAKRFATIGNCDGAHAAIRYGIELGAVGIVAASPSTYFPDEVQPKLEQGRNFKRNRMARNIPPEMMDLQPFLESRSHRVPIEIIYREENGRERAHAERLKHVPGVTLHPVAGDPGLAAFSRLALSTEGFGGTIETLLGLGTAVRGG